MKKVIRLTESDLTRIVRKVISEQALPEYDFENPKPGKLVQGDKNGKGVLKWSNAKYYGELKNGLMDGKGSLNMDVLSYKVYLKGEFKNNRQNGYGEYKNSYGETFKGNFKDGYWNGYGEFKWADGNTYKGNYKDGHRNGYGEIINPNGSIYKGNFKDGYENGYGEYKSPDGHTEKGNFKNGLLDGYGEKKFDDGSTLKGQFKDGNSYGYGIYTNQHGIKFEGQFKKGVLNGKGLYDLNQIKPSEEKFKFEGNYYRFDVDENKFYKYVNGREIKLEQSEDGNVAAYYESKFMVNPGMGSNIKEPSKQQPKTIKLPNLSDKNYYTLEGDKSWVYTKLDDGKWYTSKNKIDWYDITNNRKAVETLNKSAKITNIEDTKLQPTVEPTPNLTTTDPNKTKMGRYSPTSDLETGTDIINKMRNKGKIQSIDKTFDKKLGI